MFSHLYTSNKFWCFRFKVGMVCIAFKSRLCYSFKAVCSPVKSNPNAFLIHCMIISLYPQVKYIDIDSQACMHVHTYAHAHTRTYTHTLTCMHALTPTHIHTHTHTHPHTYMHARMHIHIHSHTNTHFMDKMQEIKRFNWKPVRNRF